MLQWLGKVIQEIPKSYGDFFVFCTLTGLRASECVSCIKLVKDPEQFKTYYNESRQALEHFRFPKVFIRRTKAAYISLVSDEFLDIARNAGNHSYNSLKMVMRHNNIDMKMNYCRKIFASHLRQSGIESEIVDLLQGRIPSTVFARNYFTPSLNYRNRVLQALEKLKQEIEQ